MSSLLDAIQFIPANDEEVEDIFAFAPGLIFTDDLRVSHGDRGATIVYHNAQFGAIRLRTAEPANEHDRRLYSHYLWNSGIKMADLIADKQHPTWNVEGESVLELGAGVGLVGIVATLSGAEAVTISDFPTQVVLENLSRNCKRNVPNRLERSYEVVGHQWGVVDTPFAQQLQHCYTRILAADCYWMPSEHENLVRSMVHFLAVDGNSRVLVTANYHTGRSCLAAFFETAEDRGLIVESIHEEDANGERRSWVKGAHEDRDDHTDRRKWLVVAILRRW